MYKVYNVVSIHIIWSIKLQITSSEVIHTHVHISLDMPHVHVCGCLYMYNYHVHVYVHICDLYIVHVRTCTLYIYSCIVMNIELPMFYLVTGVMI